MVRLIVVDCPWDDCGGMKNWKPSRKTRSVQSCAVNCHRSLGNVKNRNSGIKSSRSRWRDYEARVKSGLPLSAVKNGFSCCPYERPVLCAISDTEMSLLMRNSPKEINNPSFVNFCGYSSLSSRKRNPGAQCYFRCGLLTDD